MKTTALLILTIGVLVLNLHAQQPGNLDTTFSADGKHRIDFNGSYESAADLVVLPDGKSIIGGVTYLNGDYDYTLVKLNEDGTPDPTFGTNGVTITRIPGQADAMTVMKLLPDGKILCSGYCSSCSQHLWYLLRYKTNGTLDSTFGTNGISTSFKSYSYAGPADIELLSDSSIIAVSTMASQFGYQMVAVKYQSNGRVDSSFGVVGAVSTSFGLYDCGASCVRILPGNKILMAGSGTQNMITNRNAALLQLLPSGVRDSTFGVNGAVITDFDSLDDHYAQIAIQPDGKIIAAGMTGYINSSFAMARYHANGKIDSSFGTNGLVVNNMSVSYSDYIMDIFLQADGKIVFAARTDNNVQSPYNSSPIDFIVGRYLPNGTFDSTFGTNGITKTTFGTFNTAISKIAYAPGNKVMAVGGGFDNTLQTSDMLVARYFLGPDTTPVACVNTSYSFTETVCKGDVYVFNGNNLTATGVYTDTIPNSGGCDSVMQLTLVIDTIKYTINPGTPAQVVAMTVSAAADSYQWLNCSTGLPVPNATDSTWYFTEAGQYRCIITKGLCTDTTACVTVSVVNSMAHLTDNITLYPNPTTQQITITHYSTTPVNVFIANAAGQVVQSFIAAEATTVYDVSTLPKGIYTVTLSGHNLYAVKKLVKW